MSADKILVALLSLAGMAFTYWFFLMKKDEVVMVSDAVDIIVEGGYSPSAISIPIGKTTKISFLRKDPSSCLEEVVLSEFKIRRYLPLNKKVTIEVTPKKEGTFPFSCGMNMFHGKIIVK
ncbi:hypothetical protein A3G67_01015 [Candidatus Roizmanbacteria bacterium RIFCSPLOWO2_12_FULL_40_12]|uniref:EfeO-type cupredoxin-like domain-containing protein n=1 Tax=Candidatus Roizmanbacteria bacterium RIFCSPLOWO2_01_FULL_40_42 TaxID=1802066 RepID=A0A1F7J1Z6_9BACT|nr:MAG: hypothetical protein A2779_03670 [Candidatus Roizmanbacteria bacterium RIFCSPHIGHO2_01_FULL_40_98]OGK27679.1 MAG: hypothetical protein A3C31_04140 [Candidatus Roizmanbacteria bacterium RIFCSPHIGHO2_02_FULL_40_53]OGK29741.1 MAG: hypothetical protein A2W49_04760 [Candidatus Roizmanbacteria bacterium RIFCSPHIGHO2_12_41_18]OGK37356.1 MAG: hypothetical protein A3E69_04720 [Candidatus Roizmanbacteria bacterium RIFCSPHIGHO2_12_FULL_40_130]OGK49630.1 MAG: hypothetical protein A3B50_04225 [Candi